MANTADPYRRFYDDDDDPMDGKWESRKHKRQMRKLARRRLKNWDIKRGRPRRGLRGFEQRPCREGEFVVFVLPSRGHARRVGGCYRTRHSAKLKAQEQQEFLDSNWRPGRPEHKTAVKRVPRY